MKRRISKAPTNMAFENNPMARTIARVTSTAEFILRVLAIVIPVLALTILISSQHEAGCVELDSKAMHVYSRIFRSLVAANVILCSYAIILPLTVNFLIKWGSMSKRYFVAFFLDMMMFFLITVAMETHRNDYQEGLLLCHKVSVSFIMTCLSSGIYTFLCWFCGSSLVLLFSMDEARKEQLN